jgi:hypothetical protein
MDLDAVVCMSLVDRTTRAGQTVKSRQSTALQHKSTDNGNVSRQEALMRDDHWGCRLHQKLVKVR